MSSEIERMSAEIRRYRSGELPEEAFKKFRLENGIYGIRFQKDLQMIRIKIPYGLVTSEQMDMLGEIADIFSIGKGHVTTRQAVQFHWLTLESVPEVLRKLAEVGLTSREACGNTIRNITACPLSGVSQDEIFDINPYAEVLGKFFLRNPLNQNLPRKFKIVLESCETDHAALGMHDIGIQAMFRKKNDGSKEKGFKIWVGGGLGPPPFAAEPLEEFTPLDQLLVTCEAIVRIFDRLGNRDNMSRARLKFIIMKLGWDEFRRVVLKERVSVFATRAGDRTWKIEEYEEEMPNNLPKASERVDDSPEYERWRKTNVFPQKQEGYYYVFVTLPAGDITYEQFGALGRVGRRYAGGVLRTTRTQNLVFRWIRQDLLTDLYTDLKKAGLAMYGAHSIFNVVGCPGADTCNLAITHSHTLALELHERFSKIPELALADDLKDLDIKVSGCPNSCGQHHIADIGFYGSAQRVEGKMAPYYTLLLGGEVSKGKAIFGQPTTKVPAKNVPDAILRLVEMYRARRNPGETFREWVRRNQSESGDEPTGMEEEVVVRGR